MKMFKHRKFKLFFFVKLELEESFMGTAGEIFSISSTLMTVISKFPEFWWELKTAGRFVLFPPGTNQGLYFVLLWGKPKQFPEKKIGSRVI
mgnify:CR=1 FL=1